MAKELDGYTIVLTGASSGIGEQAALQLAARGARVCLLARRQDELQRVQTLITERGGHAWSYAVDLSDGPALDNTADRILSEHPRIDALVNNAAHSIRRPIMDSLNRAHDYERTIQLNYLAAVRLTLRFLPRFLEQGFGQVVNVSSMSTQIPIPLFSAYLASKSALESFTRSLSAELGGQGIDATVVYFPMVRTPMSSRTDIYKHMPMMSRRTAAGWIVKAIVKRPARVSSPLGVLGSVALSMLPGPAVSFTRPFFRLMDEQLARRLKQKKSSS